MRKLIANNRYIKFIILKNKANKDKLIKKLN